MLRGSSKSTTSSRKSSKNSKNKSSKSKRSAITPTAASPEMFLDLPESKHCPLPEAETGFADDCYVRSACLATGLPSLVRFGRAASGVACKTAMQQASRAAEAPSRPKDAFCPLRQYH